MNTQDLCMKLRTIDAEWGDEQIIEQLGIDAALLIEAFVKHLQGADFVLQEWQKAYEQQAEVIEQLEAALKAKKEDEPQIIYPH